MNEKRREAVRFGLRMMEIFLVIFVILILISLSIPSVSKTVGYARLSFAVSNARQIYLLTSSAALDRVTQKDNSIGWPGELVPAIGDNGGFIRMLLDGGYLQYRDLRVFGAGCFVTNYDAEQFDAQSGCGFKIYRVGEEDLPESIFLTTRNVRWRNGTLETDPEYQAQFNSREGFVVFHKGGDGKFFLADKPQQAYGSVPKAGPEPLAKEGIIKALYSRIAQKSNNK